MSHGVQAMAMARKRTSATKSGFERDSVTEIKNFSEMSLPSYDVVAHAPGYPFEQAHPGPDGDGSRPVCLG